MITCVHEWPEWAEAKGLSRARCIHCGVFLSWRKKDVDSTDNLSLDSPPESSYAQGVGEANDEINPEPANGI